MEDTRYRTFWQRIGANLIDGLIVGAATAVVMAPLLIFVLASSLDADKSPGGAPELDLSSSGEAAIAATVFIATAGSYLYTIGMLAKFGQTIGKMATGIVVLDHRTEAPIGWRQAFMRSAGEIAILTAALAVFAAAAVAGAGRPAFDRLDTFHTVIAYGWWIAEVLTMLTNPRRRALHDFIGGTVVVKKKHLDTTPQRRGEFAQPPAGLGW